MVCIAFTFYGKAKTSKNNMNVVANKFLLKKKMKNSKKRTQNF